MTTNQHRAIYGLPSLLSPNSCGSPATNKPLTSEEIKNFLESFKELEKAAHAAQTTSAEEFSSAQKETLRDPFLDLKCYTNPEDIANQGVFVPGKLYRVRKNIQDGEFAVLTTPGSTTNPPTNSTGATTISTLLISKENIDTVKDGVFLCVRTTPIDGNFKAVSKNGEIKFLDRKWSTDFLYDEKLYTFVWYENPEAASEEHGLSSAGSISGWSNTTTSPNYNNYGGYYSNPSPSYTYTKAHVTLGNPSTLLGPGTYNTAPTLSMPTTNINPYYGGTTTGPGNQWTAYGNTSNTLNYNYTPSFAYKLQGANFFEEIPGEFEEKNG